tara:strand:+ start:474 stop:791 length:318 start_codon:yes stop_codon:yes gene_type:complete
MRTRTEHCPANPPIFDPMTTDEDIFIGAFAATNKWRALKSIFGEVAKRAQAVIVEITTPAGGPTFSIAAISMADRNKIRSEGAITELLHPEGAVVDDWFMGNYLV